MTDRRTKATTPVPVPGTASRTFKRRMGDRRDSVRVAVDLRVRRPGQARFETFQGDLSIGGARVLLEHPPFGTQVEVALKLPRQGRELRLLGEVIRVTGGGKQYNAHIKFAELAVSDELAIARFLDEAAAVEDD